MACHVDHVIGARHDIEVAVLVYHPCIASLVEAREMRQIAFAEAVLGIPERWQCARRQGEFDGDGAQLACGHRVACLIEDLHVIAGHRHCG